jgi:hypothetical protein
LGAPARPRANRPFGEVVAKNSGLIMIVNFSEAFQATISVDERFFHIVLLIGNFAAIDAVAFGGRYREDIW